MPPKGLSVDPFEPPHATYQIMHRCFEQELVMRIHQTVGIAPPPILRHPFVQQADKCPAVAVSEEDRLLSVASRSHMIKHTRKMQSKGLGRERVAWG